MQLIAAVVCLRGGSVPAPFLGSPGGWRSSWLSLQGVTYSIGSAALLPALLAIPLFPGWCALLLRCGSFSRHQKFQKLHRKCRTGRTHRFFTDFMFLSKEMIAEKMRAQFSLAFCVTLFSAYLKSRQCLAENTNNSPIEGKRRIIIFSCFTDHYSSDVKNTKEKRHKFLNSRKSGI